MDEQRDKFWPENNEKCVILVINVCKFGLKWIPNRKVG